MPKDVNVERLKKIQKNIKSKVGAIRGHKILVGVPQRNNTTEANTGIGMADLAYIHNFGAPKANIPPRPFMEPGIENTKEKVAGLLEKIKGEPDLKEVIKTLEMIGLVGEGEIKAIFTNNNWTPLKPGTIRARERNGRRGDRPLIVTGALRNSISSEVIKR